ncbi:MAG: DEAD/DEAH box helicase [Bacteroidales bacterium]|nr:DEAD/DEAH box helicase [Bacteroidales bacterium]
MQTFEELGLSEEILKAIGELGFETPTPVQARSIPEILNKGQDVISLAQTGTGKTGAFGLPIVQMTDDNTSLTQALILCPTRELCLQITKDLHSFAKYRERVQIIPVYGGSEIRTQIRALKGPAHIIVGTPGRVIDLIERGALKIGEIRWLILDEADEMLNMGFKDDLETILAETPQERQTMLFSATMPPFIASIASNYMKDPLKITIGQTNQGADTVEHHYYMVKASDRYLALKRIVDMIPDIYGIIFCRTRQETKEIADKLIADGYNADALHGDLSQAQRDMVMQRFRMKHLQLLVATDVAARGIDVTDLTHVINYNLPDDPEVYIHRSGRTGRAGKKGVSISIIHSKEMGRIKQIEKMSKKQFTRSMVPTAEEICQSKLLYFIDGIEKQEFDEQSTIAQFIPQIIEKLSSFSKDDLIRKIVASEFEAVNKYYQNATDLNIYPEEKGKDRRRGDDEKFDRLFINIGRMDHTRPSELIGLVNSFMRDVNEKINIGHIDIMRNFSFIDVDPKYSDAIVKTMNGQKIDGYKLIVELSTPREKQGEKRFKKGGFNDDRRDRKRDRDRGDRRDREEKRDRSESPEKGGKKVYHDRGFRAEQKAKKERKRERRNRK